MAHDWMLFVLALFLALNTVISQRTLDNADELNNFFSTSYIEKEKGHFSIVQERVKAVYAEGYEPSWGFHRFHHVCFRGGGDGIYTGITGVKSSKILTEDNLSQKQWNAYIGSQYNHPLAASDLDPTQISGIKKIFMYSNSTLFTNCYRQSTNAYNPSRLMMKIGFLYELADCYMKNFGRHKIFENTIVLPFKQMFLHQCPNPYSSNWEWGKVVSEIIYKKLETSLVLRTNHSIVLHRGNESPKDELLCFEDAYLSARTGHWLQGADHAVNFRKEAASMTGEPAEANLIYERPAYLSAAVLQHYCPKPHSANPDMTSAVIKIFQRTENSSPRTIVNIKEVVDTVQKFTYVPVEVITMTEKTPIKEQIKIFNSFDILITVHGSHLTNGIFTIRPYTKAVIEMVPFVYETLYYKNYLGDLGFADYVISSGHLTPQTLRPRAPGTANVTSAFCAFDDVSDFMRRNCKYSASEKSLNRGTKVDQTWILCDPSLHSRACDTFVNTTILKNHLSALIKTSLCKNLSETP